MNAIVGSVVVVALIVGCVGAPLAGDAPAPTSTADKVGVVDSPPAAVTPTASEVAQTTTEGPTKTPIPRATSGPTRNPEPSDDDGDGFQLPEPPPAVTVHANETTFELVAWTYCYGNGCVDGRSPARLPDVGDVARVDFEFPLDGWTFEASFKEVGPECPRWQHVPAVRAGPNAWYVEPAGPAATYDVILFGRGEGDLFVGFRWRTPHDGPMPVPDGRLAVLADHDGRVDSYGVELELSDLRATPRSARAEVTVTAANGNSMTFTPRRESRCFGEGVVYWEGPDRAGRRAAKLGPPPFTLTVVVVLDGVRYTGHARWPDDTIEGNEPSVSLTFSPPLPALP